MRPLVLLVCLAAIILASGTAFAQPGDEAPAAADSTGAASGGGMLGAIGQQSIDANAADADSIRQAYEQERDEAAPPPPTLYERVAPTATMSVISNVVRIQMMGEISASLAELFEARGKTSYSQTTSTFRQQDRDQEQRVLTTALQDTIPLLGGLDFSMRRGTNYDENRPRAGTAIVLDNRQTDADLKFKGRRGLAAGFTHNWAVVGEFEDVQQENRGVKADKQAAGAGITSEVVNKSAWVDLLGRYGFHRNSGSAVLSDLDSDVSAARDTLYVEAKVNRGQRLTLSLDTQRATFIEERPDFSRNASGQVDTAQALIKVGAEREREVSRASKLKLKVRPIRWLSFDTSASESRAEQTFKFSKQGLVVREESKLNLSGWLRYAEAGSVQVVYEFNDRGSDRRRSGALEFRGRDSQRSYELRTVVRHRLLQTINFEFNASETLSQSIFGDPLSQGDRDRLTDRFGAKIISTAIPNTEVTITANLSQELLRNIDASKVAGNKNDDLFEVSAQYDYDPPNGLKWGQRYKMQIKFVDQLANDDRDQFNKQGQIDNKLGYDFSNGVRSHFQYVLDFRSTGIRIGTIPDRKVYNTTQRRFDHRMRGDLVVPWRWFVATIATERGYITNETQRGENDESNGRINIKLEGKQSWLENRVALALNVERVLQFGPNVRDDGRDYWNAQSSLTVLF